MTNLMTGEGYQDEWVKNPTLYLLMYTGELEEGTYLNVIIKDTTFSTHKVFNETYARLKIYNESRKDDYATFRGVVNIAFATRLLLESKYPITLLFIDNTFFNNYDM
jgi:hypothetical protein